MRGFEIVLALVAAATIIAALAERLRAPAPSMLVVAGLGVGLIPGVPEISPSPHLVAYAVLPPLLYAAATDVAVSELRRVLGMVAALAVGLVLVTAVAIAYVTHAVFGQISLGAGFVLGAVLASTDPVAVSALARRLHLPGRLLALVQGESLLNDATSLVLFTVAVGVVTEPGAVGGWDIAWRFVRLAGGGALLGAGAAYLTRLVRARVHDPVLNTVLALVVPYGLYTAAEACGLSGVTAVVVAGLVLSERRATLEVSTAAARLQTATVYGVLQFLLESVIFAVIGLELPQLVRHLPAGDRGYLLGTVALVATVLGVRAAWTFASAQFGWGRRDGARSRWQVATVVVWVGTRGVVPLAAALSIPLLAHGVPFPHRDLLLVLTTAVILTTLVVQGLTLEPLVRRLGVTESAESRADHEARAWVAAIRAALERLEELADLGSPPEVVTSRLRAELTRQLGLAEQAQEPDDEQAASLQRTEAAVRRDVLGAAAAELFTLRDEGSITEAARRRIQRILDRTESGGE